MPLITYLLHGYTLAFFIVATNLTYFLIGSLPSLLILHFAIYVINRIYVMYSPPLEHLDHVEHHDHHPHDHYSHLEHL